MRFKAKVLHSEPAGEIWMTIFSLLDADGILPQHVIIYSEEELQLKVNDETTFSILERDEVGMD